MTTYYTALDIAAIADFYRQQLPAQGWTENTNSSFADENTALLSFAKDGATLTIAASKESEGRVNVSLIQQ